MLLGIWIFECYGEVPTLLYLLRRQQSLLLNISLQLMQPGSPDPGAHFGYINHGFGSTMIGCHILFWRAGTEKDAHSSIVAGNNFHDMCDWRPRAFTVSLLGTMATMNKSADGMKCRLDAEAIFQKPRITLPCFGSKYTTCSMLCEAWSRLQGLSWLPDLIERHSRDGRTISHQPVSLLLPLDRLCRSGKRSCQILLTL